MSTKIHYTATVQWTGDTARQIELHEVTTTTTAEDTTETSRRRVKVWQPLESIAPRTDEDLWDFLYEKNFLTTPRRTRTKDGRTKTVVLTSRYIDPDGTPKGLDVPTPQVPAEPETTTEDTGHAEDAAAWKLAELDHLSTLIKQNEAALRELYAQRVQKVKDLMHLDGVGATEVAGRLGISRRRVYKMIEQPQGPVAPGPELF